jgi:rhodanese-related sulfurtransferase
MEQDLHQVRRDLEQNRAILIDVREQEEWDEDHLSCARLIPITQLTQNIPDDLPSDKKIYVHCRRGGRAKQAAELLQLRYEDVVPLKCEYDLLKSVLE